MNKSLLLLPLLGLPALCLAEVQLYGTVKSGVEISRTKTGNDTYRSQTAVRDHGSYIGMSGSFPLGSAASTGAEAPADSGSMRDRLRRKKENGPMLPLAE